MRSLPNRSSFKRRTGRNGVGMAAEAGNGNGYPVRGTDYVTMESRGASSALQSTNYFGQVRWVCAFYEYESYQS